MPEKGDEYNKLITAISNCRKCGLHRFRKKPVPGEGPLDAEVMVIGEAPGRQEDESGRPFVGAAGKLLDYLLSLAGFSRSKVYITNVVKCRPPRNRDPTQEEIAACLPYLIAQIKLIKPKYIIALGRIAGKTLYSLMGRKWRGMSVEHGVVVEGTIAGVHVRLVATYHPAAALYKPDVKRVLEEDFREVISRLKKGGEGGKTLLDFL